MMKLTKLMNGVKTFTATTAEARQQQLFVALFLSSLSCGSPSRGVERTDARVLPVALEMQTPS